jgi:purine catabolism regulator
MAAAITVGDVLHDALPAGTRVLGGGNGLGRAVARALPQRSSLPVFREIRGRELVVVHWPTLVRLDPSITTVGLVERLAEAGIAALAVVAAPADVAAAGQAAERLDLPLLGLPADASDPAALALAIDRYLVEREAVLNRRGHELHGEFAAVVLAGGDVGALLERLAAVTGLPAAWESADLVLRRVVPAGGAAPGAPLDEAAVVAALRATRLLARRWAMRATRAGTPTGAAPPAAANDLPVGRIAVESPGTSGTLGTPPAGHRMAPLLRLVAPVSGGNGQTEGYLSLVGPAVRLGTEAEIALGRAAMAAAMALAREAAVAAARDEVSAGFVRDLFDGRFASEGEAVQRGRRLGYDLAPPYAVLTLDAGASPAGPVLIRALRSLEAGGVDPLAALLRPAPQALVAAERTAGVAALPVQRPEPSALAAALPAIAASLAASLDAGADEPGHEPRHEPRGEPSEDAAAVSAGLSRPVGRILELPDAVREARRAQLLGRRLPRPAPVTYYGNLGLFRLLASFGGPAAGGEHDTSSEPQAFCDETLGPLVDGDPGGDLLKTLEAYLATGGSPTEAAARLHTHRNTVLYRLSRIEQVLGADLRDPEQRLQLHVALKGRAVLPASPRAGTSG